MGAAQQLQLRSWPPQVATHFSKTIPFAWEAGRWYTMKFEARTKDGDAHLRGKIEYLRGYRFTICPENSRTRGAGGYNTEKLGQAHHSGAVPIYWGDAIDTEVFNPARVIVFNGSNAEAVRDTMRELLWPIAPAALGLAVLVLLGGWLWPLLLAALVFGLVFAAGWSIAAPQDKATALALIRGKGRRSA
jgi:hypothetical protein